MPHNPIDKLDAATRAPLDAFRADCPPCTVAAGGMEWEVIDTGAPPHPAPVLLALPGLLGAAETSWMTLKRVAPRMRAIAVSYPLQIDTMSALADGLAALCDALGLGEVALLGSSYGGMVAQVLARRHPQRITRMVLANTGAPAARRVARLRAALAVFRYLPEGVLRAMLDRQAYRLLKFVPGSAARLTVAQMQEVVWQRMDRQAILNAYRRTLEFDGGWQSQPGSPYTGPTLLLFGERDPLTRNTPTRSMREELAALYPQAEMRVFESSGHAAALIEPDAFFGAIEEFVLRA